MTKLKLGAIETDKPVRVTIRLPAPLYRDIEKYGATLARETKRPALTPDKLIPAMLEHFITTDRGFAKLRREGEAQVPSDKLS